VTLPAAAPGYGGGESVDQQRPDFYRLLNEFF
jgi:hypothetical protein